MLHGLLVIFSENLSCSRNLVVICISKWCNNHINMFSEAIVGYLYTAIIYKVVFLFLFSLFPPISLIFCLLFNLTSFLHCAHGILESAHFFFILKKVTLCQFYVVIWKKKSLENRVISLIQLKGCKNLMCGLTELLNKIWVIEVRMNISAILCS